MQREWAIAGTVILLAGVLLVPSPVRIHAQNDSFAAFRQTIVRIADGEIGKVRDANAGNGQKQGANRLVQYYKEAWQKEYLFPRLGRRDW